MFDQVTTAQLYKQYEYIYRYIYDFTMGFLPPGLWNLTSAPGAIVCDDAWALHRTRWTRVGAERFGPGDPQNGDFTSKMVT
jgi:hypothetical protein